MAKTSNPSTGSTTTAPSTTKGAPLNHTTESVQSRTHAPPEHTATSRSSGLTTTETDTPSQAPTRKVALVLFSKPVKPFEDTGSAYQLKTDDRLKLTTEGGLIIGTYAGKTAGTIGAVGWPIQGDFVREIRFADVPGSLESSTTGAKTDDTQKQVETPQGTGAPRATSGEAVTNGGVPGTGKNLPPKDGQSREDSKQLPSEENDSREQEE